MQTIQISLFSILYSKFLRYIEDTPASDLFISFAKLFTWSIISISLINIPESIENLAIALKWYDFAILKILTSFVLVFHSKNIVRMCKNIMTWIVDELNTLIPKKTEWNLYQWIPIIELVDYLFTSPSYGRSEFCEKFAVSRTVFDSLFSSFDKLMVTVRGSNNSRVLSTDFSRADISSILTRASESGDIRPLIRKTESGYTHSPSMWEIESRCKTMTLAEYAS